MVRPVWTRISAEDQVMFTGSAPADDLTAKNLGSKVDGGEPLQVSPVDLKHLRRYTLGD